MKTEVQITRTSFLYTGRYFPPTFDPAELVSPGPAITFSELNCHRSKMVWPKKLCSRELGKHCLLIRSTRNSVSLSTGDGRAAIYGCATQHQLTRQSTGASIPSELWYCKIRSWGFFWSWQQSAGGGGGRNRLIHAYMELYSRCLYQVRLWYFIISKILRAGTGYPADQASEFPQRVQV